MVFHIFPEERQGVYAVAGLVLYDIQVQMRSEGVSGITAQSNDLSDTHGIFIGAGRDVHLPTFTGILQVFHPLRHLAHKGTEVAVDGGIAVVVGHMEHIARTVGDTYARHMPVGQCPHRLAGTATGLEIEATVKMVCPYLAEITAECKGKIKGRHKSTFLRLHARHGEQGTDW